jgi:hypothetical protein
MHLGEEATREETPEGLTTIITGRTHPYRTSLTPYHVALPTPCQIVSLRKDKSDIQHSETPQLA